TDLMPSHVYFRDDPATTDVYTLSLHDALPISRWVTSDGLTALGVVGALGTGAAYALSTLSVAWLWAASALLVVQWFGDSLDGTRSEEHTSELQSRGHLVCRLLLEKKKIKKTGQ